MITKCRMLIFPTPDLYKLLTATPFHFLSFLDFALAGAESLEPDLLDVSSFCRFAGSVLSGPPFVLIDTSTFPALFCETTWPTIGISDASHCWKGFATKNPFTSNHRVNGDEITRVLSFCSISVYLTVRVYTGVCLVTLDAMDNLKVYQRCVLDKGSQSLYHTWSFRRMVHLARENLSLFYCPDPYGQSPIQREIHQNGP